MLHHLITTLEWLLPAAYFTLWGFHARAFLQMDHVSTALIKKPPLYGLLATHLLFLALRGAAQEAWPLASKAEFLSLLSVSIFAVWLLTERDEEEVHTGIFFLGIAAPFQLLASLMMVPVALATHSPLLEHPIFGIHVIFIVLGFAALAVGALDAVMYILLSRQLKAREMGLFFKKLPPLIQLEGMSRTATTAGVALLGVGLFLGHFVALYVLGDFNPLDPKVFMTDLAWLAYLIGWILVKVRSISGLRVAYLSVSAFVLLMVTIILSNLIGSSFHSFQG